MDPILGGLLIGGLTGGAKYAGDVAGHNSDKKVAATTAKWSPWTGMQNKVRHANFAEDVLPSAVQGAALGGGDFGKKIFGGTTSPWDAASKFGLQEKLMKGDL